MKPAPFSYWDPATLEQALTFLKEHGEDTRLLAGGQSLVPMLNLRLARPRYLVDLNRIPGLDEVCEEDGVVRIGALCRHAALESSVTEEHCPLVARAVPHIGHRAIRYRGTIGGSLVQADPAAELPAVAMALGAKITLKSSRGSRSVRAEDFFVGHLVSAIASDEILTDVRFSRANGARTGAAVAELTRRHGDFALAGIAVQVSIEDDRIGAARLCAFGVGHTPIRLAQSEALLAGATPTEEVIREAAQASSTAVEPRSDMHASAGYRRQMCAVLFTRAIATAIDDAGGLEP